MFAFFKQSHSSQKINFIRRIVELAVPNHINLDIFDNFHLLRNLRHFQYPKHLPSIKDLELLEHIEKEIPYAITGPLKSIPTVFNESWKDMEFKKALVAFLCVHRSDSSLSSILLTVGEHCFVFKNDNDTLNRE